MAERKYKFKKGAASFYIVAFSTLILLIVATSFAAVIISEVTRTANDDLAQSAYDSALAGVEDAKLAFYSYQNCLKQTSKEVVPDGDDNLICGEIIWYMNHPDCDMVANILGRDVDEEKGVMVEETSGGNNMEQSYTCVKIQTELSDYKSTLSPTDQMKAVKVKFDDVPTKDIKKVKISWFSDANGNELNYKNFSESKVTFVKSQANGEPTPPTISLALIQTAGEFTLSDFEQSRDGMTDRGMIYLVPASEEAFNAIGEGEKDYEVATDGNQIGANALVKSNDKVARNLPYVVKCDREGGFADFACSAMIELPSPIGEVRNDETFVFVVGLPYGAPSTDFMLEFYCGDDETCGETIAINEEGEQVETPTNKAKLDGVQISIDSTGRANDMYRRVEARLEGSSGFSLSLMGPLELLGIEGNSGDLLNKNYSVKCEVEFGPSIGCNN
jgi:hypothetical protein